MTMKEQEQEQHIAGGVLVEVEGEELRELGCEVGIGNCSQVVAHVTGFERRLQQSTRHVRA